MAKKLNLGVAQIFLPGASLNTLPRDYFVSPDPIGDKALHGPLAHVSEEDRKKIMATGFGEMSAHIEHIQRKIGKLKVMKKKNPRLYQHMLDLGEKK